ncbi:hypothetical protein [Roseateles puraquae]|uniref:Uncharacterized protein n=1 Tax=Roseateles puraquae TaxID=431059 RepID=A0A254N7P6_9BURK|nr:hypothetical protein [Roseateles puraquae]MDG0856375.1 hypothetical protein [Roseateles puraquae]OWR02397.1 hypothetical protein CDO81_19605 [Roseateles puraquae]
MAEPITDFDCFEDYANRIRWMLALLAWVEDARYLVDRIDIQAQIRPRFREQLNAADVRYALNWSEDQSAGMQELQTLIAGMTAEMAQAGQALVRQRRAA